MYLFLRPLVGLLREVFRWLEMATSFHSRVDGLWIGISGNGRDDEVADRTLAALLLIKTHDPRRYTRVVTAFRRLLVHLLDYPTRWYPKQKRCEIDARFVLRSSSEVIAATIVHEATRARLSHGPLDEVGARRGRIEQICRKQARAFALKLPDHDEVLDVIDDQLAYSAEFWTEKAIRTRHTVDEVKVAQDAGIPDWLIKAILAFRKRRGRL